jgi:hypothetical protein
MSDRLMRWLAPLPALIAGPALGETYLTLAQAQAQMFPGDSLTKLSVELDAAQAAAIADASGVALRDRKPKVWRASGGGWFFVDQVLGKHEYITYALALDAAGAVRAVEVLDYRESWGGGIRDARWRAQFTGKTAAAPLKLGQDIANLSGATLSCRHVTEGVRRLLATQAELARRG